MSPATVAEAVVQAILLPADATVETLEILPTAGPLYKFARLSSSRQSKYNAERKSFLGGTLDARVTNDQITNDQATHNQVATSGRGFTRRNPGAAMRAQDAAKGTPIKPPDSPSKVVLDSWNDIGRKLIAMAEDFPEDKYDFKPTPAQRSFAEQLLHMAGANYYFTNPVIGKKPPTGDPKRDQYKTKADVVAFVKKSFADEPPPFRQRATRECLNRWRTHSPLNKTESAISPTVSSNMTANTTASSLSITVCPDWCRRIASQEISSCCLYRA